MNHESWSHTRYAGLGGLDEVAAQYRGKMTTLKEIASKTCVSKQTVHNDLVRAFGRQWLEDAKMERRKNARQDRVNSGGFSGEPISVDAAIQRLRSDSGALSPELARLTAQALEMLKLHGVGRVKGKQAFGLTAVESKRGWCNFRAAVARPNLAEYKMNLHRLRPFVRPSPSGIDIYAVSDLDSSPVIYVFNHDDIGKIRSLNLRFKKNAGPSKYSYAMDRWSVLKGAS